MCVSSYALQLLFLTLVVVTTCLAIVQNQDEGPSGVRRKRQAGASSTVMILPQESSEDYLLAASVTTPLSTPAYSSASHTAPIMPATEPGRQVCSFGEVIWPLDGSDKLNESGTYLFPNAISCNGYLESLHSCFFYNDEENSNITNFQMRVGVFRQMGDNYEQIGLEGWIDLDVTRASTTETQRCVVRFLTGQPSVLQGDKIAVQVINGCNQSVCPLQPNLRAAPSASAFFTPTLVDTVPASQIMATTNYANVHLNVGVRIVLTPPPNQLSTSVFSSSYVSPSPMTTANTEQATIIGGAVGTAVAVLILVLAVVGTSMLVVLKRCNRKKVAVDTDLQQLTEKQMTGPRHTNRYTTISTFHDNTELDSIPAELTTSSPVSEQLHLLPENLVIPGSCIKLLKSIGEGAFGIVYKAHYSRNEGSAVETVAVKSLKAIFTAGDLRNLVKEIQLMQFFDHPNVMPLLGVCLDAGCPEAKSAPCLVMPYMANGSLLAYLRKAKKDLVLPKDTTSKQVELVQTKLLKMCYEIAVGMKYLADQKFVHRDLSARNCMMSSDGIIKVADFGLAEDIYTKNYFRVDTSKPIAVPFKWMPLESLEEGVYNEKTDMWSFGITSWEIFTGGKIPYTAMSVREVLQLLKSGGRLEKPENAACPENIYTMMLDCWDDDPEKRPHFLQVATTLSNMLQTVSGYLNLDHFQVEESSPPVSLLPPADKVDPPSTPIKEAPPSPNSPDEI